MDKNRVSLINLFSGARPNLSKPSSETRAAEQMSLDFAGFCESFSLTPRFSGVWLPDANFEALQRFLFTAFRPVVLLKLPPF